jgi:cytochrome c5
MKPSLMLTALALLASTAINAEEKPISVKDAPGRDVVERSCAICHSLDYLRIHAGFMDHKAWEAEVNKMINAYGAPIKHEDAQAIIEYLATNYGAGAK